MDNAQTLYTINKFWALVVELFFGALALLVMDSRFFHGLLISGLIISVFIFVFAHEPNIESFRKYESIKDISGRKLPVTSDIRITMSALISLIIMLALFLICASLPDKLMSDFDMNSLAINFLVMLAFFLYTLIVQCIYRFSIQFENYDLTRSPYYKCTYKVQNIKYIKTAVVVLLISCSIIAYRVYQVMGILDSGRKVFFYY